MSLEALAWIIGVLVLLGYILMLFKIAQDKQGEYFLFYSLLYVPQAIGILITFFLFQLSLVIIAAIIVERVVDGIILYRVAGEDKLVWFYIIYLIPLVGWFLYLITDVR